MVGIGVAARANTPMPTPPIASQPTWIPLSSQRSADIQAAVKQSNLFHLNTAGPGDHPHDLSRLGTPIYIAALPLPGYSQPVDSYVTPVLDASGRVTDVAVGWLNPTHTAMYVAYIRSFDNGLAQWPALPDTQSAVAIMHADAKVAPLAGAQPRLVYFPFDYLAERQGKLHWTAGGRSPDDPIWDIAGADGKEHFIGANNRAYLVSELPLAHP
jgi:hypothetical protein